jgi:3-oxoacyl-[acyl-carrier protein] reductase
VVAGVGSPTGIGFAVCQRLGELGAAVMLTATTERVHERVGELEASGIRAKGLVADLTDRDAAETIVEAVTGGWNRLDIRSTTPG